MGNETKVEVNHIGKTIADVAEDIGKDKPVEATINAIAGLAAGPDKGAGVSLADVGVSKNTDDYSLHAGGGVKFGYNPFGNEVTGGVELNAGVEVPYDKGVARVNVTGEYDIQEGFKTGIHGGYTESDPSRRIHTWTADSYVSLASSGEVEGAVRGEAQMRIYKDSDGRLLSVYGQAAVGTHTTYGAGASIEAGLQKEIKIPYFGNALLRGGVGLNSTDTNFNDRSRIDTAQADLNTGSNHEGTYGKISLGIRF